MALGRVKALDAGVGLFPPWFVPMEVFKQFQRMLPAYYHQRFRLYFDRFGCICCKRKRVLYCCSGLCISCSSLINERLRLPACSVFANCAIIGGCERCLPGAWYTKQKDSFPKFTGIHEHTAGIKRPVYVKPAVRDVEPQGAVGKLLRTEDEGP